MRVSKASAAMLAVASLLAFVAANHLVGLAGTASNPIDGIDAAVSGFWASFVPGHRHAAALYTTADALMWGLVGTALVWGAWAWHESRGTFRRGEEHGSARWATKAEMDAFADLDVPVDNTLLSRDVRLRYTRNPRHSLQRNRNVLVIGGSGSGKTRGYVKPNLMQVPSSENVGPVRVPAREVSALAARLAADGTAASRAAARAMARSRLEEEARLRALEGQDRYAQSYVVTDPKGTTIVETGYVHAVSGYKVKCFNVVDFSESCHYNPLSYIETPEEILSFITCLIRNTNDKDAGRGDQFWEDSERMLYLALINYILSECPPEQRNLVTMAGMLDMGKVEGGGMSALDLLFYELETGLVYDPGEPERAPSSGNEKRAALDGTSFSGPTWRKGPRPPQPNHPAVLHYNSFKSGAEDTVKSILISCKVRLARLRSPEVSEILSYDELELERIGDEKTVLYIVPDDQDPTYNFLIAMLMWQLLKKLKDRADTRYRNEGGRLPYGVTCLLDEVANFYIPDLEKTLATCRSRNIGVSMILQSQSQLKRTYGDDADTIVDCCDTTLFLGGKSTETNEDLSKQMGQQTVTTDNASRSHGERGGWSEQQAQHGRELMQQAEIAKMDKDECLVLISGANPWRGRKYDIESHPMYGFCDPGHEGAAFARGFDFAAYRSNRRYYETDTVLELSSRVTACRAVPGVGAAPVWRFRYVLELRNAGGAPAYDLRADLETSFSCASNERARREGRKVPYPLAEPTPGDLAGIVWECAEMRACHVAADGTAAVEGGRIASAPDGGRFRLRGADLEPGGRLVVVLAFEYPAASLDSILSSGWRGMGRPVDPEPCALELAATAMVQCANADAPAARRASAGVEILPPTDAAESGMVSLEEAGDGR